MNINLPKSHPRYHSLLFRERIIQGQSTKVVAPAGLIAHGRGEAFDYLMGEKTRDYAQKAQRAAVASLLLAKHPVLSINGNVAALDPEGLVELANNTNSYLEVNLFYRTPGREEAIQEVLIKAGAIEILGVGKDASATIPELQSDRRRVSPKGILISDVVFVPLEDGDRTEALVNMGKTVITVDLNPLSRTARKSQITIVNNFVRSIGEMNSVAIELKNKPPGELKNILSQYNNQKTLSESLYFMSQRLKELAEPNES